MDDDYAIPGLGTYAAPGWNGSSADQPSYTPRDADAPLSSPSQVPGTSGAPSSTPSVSGPVSTGSPGSTPGGSWFAQIFGGLAGGGGVRPIGANQQQIAQALKLMQLGGRMLQPPANPFHQGAPPPQLSAIGQNPQVTQFQQMFGVDAETAQKMMAWFHPGGTAMLPSQQSQLTFGGGAFQPGQAPPPNQTAMLPSSGMPTPQNPYGRPAMAMGPTTALPQLGAGAFMPSGVQPAPLQSQMLYGAFA